MTDDFRELTSRLARAVNFPDGTAILITSRAEDSNVQTMIKGDLKTMLLGITTVLELMLDQPLDQKHVRLIHNEIRKILIADEQKRFQEAKMGDDADAPRGATNA